MWLKHVKAIINHLMFDGLYHPCMVSLGIVYYCFNHITFCLNTSSLLGSSNRLTSPSSMWMNDLNVVETIIDLLEDNVMMSCDIFFSRYSTTVSLKKKDHNHHIINRFTSVSDCFSRIFGLPWILPRDPRGKSKCDSFFQRRSVEALEMGM